MRRVAFSCVATLMIFAVTPTANAQPKPKDPAMYSEMQNQFARVSDALSQILNRLSAIEGEVNRLKQVENEVRNTQALVKASDDKFTQFKDTTGRDLVNVTRDMAQLRSEVMNLNSEIARARAVQSPAPATTAPAAPLPEGYITQVSDTEVTINLGSNAGVRAGMRFAVFKAGDANKTQIGVVTIKEVLTGDASKAEISFKLPDVQFQFSDGVRAIL